MTNHSSWTTTCSHPIPASAEQIWAIWLDTSRWSEWNEGVAAIVLEQDFSSGQNFAMHLPDGEIIQSRLIDVQPNQGFTDECQLGETIIRVEHRIEVLAPGQCQVTYCTTVQGPQAEEIGQMVSGDFPAVLERLAGYTVERSQG